MLKKRPQWCAYLALGNCMLMNTEQVAYRFDKQRQPERAEWMMTMYKPMTNSNDLKHYRAHLSVGWGEGCDQWQLLLLVAKSCEIALLLVALSPLSLENKYACLWCRRSQRHCSFFIGSFLFEDERERRWPMWLSCRGDLSRKKARVG